MFCSEECRRRGRGRGTLRPGCATMSPAWRSPSAWPTSRSRSRCRIPLTYEIPAAWESQARPGVRARVLIGRRRLTGLIVSVHDERPEGVDACGRSRRSSTASRCSPPDLLELARFTADYYMAPLGEVVRTMLPADLPPWGDRKVWLTDAGALSLPRAAAEAAVIDGAARGGADDRRRAPGPGRRLPGSRRDARRPGREGADRQRGAPGPFGALHQRRRAGPGGARRPSAPRPAARWRASEVVNYLAALGRPATTAEVTGAPSSCTPAVVRRLVSLGVLRQFTQVERLSLDRHMMGGTGQAPRDPSAPGPGARPRPADRRVDAGEFAPLLLQGMTGSGKTEVYLRAAEEALARGRSTDPAGARDRARAGARPRRRDALRRAASPSCTPGWASASATRSGSGCAAARRAWCSAPARPCSRRSPTSA